MNFHSKCKCRLISMREPDTMVRYDVMSGDEYLGTLRFCPILSEWIMNVTHNIGITQEFMSQVWSNLSEELARESQKLKREIEEWKAVSG